MFFPIDLVEDLTELLFDGRRNRLKRDLAAFRSLETCSAMVVGDADMRWHK